MAKERPRLVANQLVSEGYLDRMATGVEQPSPSPSPSPAPEPEPEPSVCSTGLRHWVDGGKRGDLTWGIFLFQK